MFTVLKRMSAVGAIVALSVTAAPAVAQAETTPGWHIAHSSPGFPRDDFSDIAVTGPGDAWAVGSGPCCVQGEHRKISHWDGSEWRDVTPPEAPGGDRAASLTKVAASSPANVWTFGITFDGEFYGHHWDGSTWRTTVFDPDIGIADAAVLAPDDAWFVGSQRTEDGEVGIASHYDGSGWTTMPLPIVPEEMSAARGAVWATGRTGNGAPATVRWTGSSWRKVPLPKPKLSPGVSAFPGDVLALGPRDAWATMVLGKDESVWPGAVLYHWNGRRWRQVRIDAPEDMLYRLAPDGRGGLWIVSQHVHESAYLLHYSRGRVTRQPAPTGDGTAASIEAIALVPGTRSLLAAGILHTEQSWAAAIYRYDPR